MIKEIFFDEKPHRILVCMSDWIFGQVIMIEDLLLISKINLDDRSKNNINEALHDFENIDDENLEINSFFSFLKITKPKRFDIWGQSYVMGLQ